MQKADVKVVIVGGGFGGITAAKTLGNRDGIRVVLLDRHNYHLFQPLLYQVAMAGLSPAEIAVPIRTTLAAYKNIEVLLGEVIHVQPERKAIDTELGEITYDKLILACGAYHNYFGHEEWEPFAPGLKSLEQATEIRRRVLLAFEKAEVEKDPEKQKAHLTFVVVGGGPTGIELAGAIGEISKYTLSRDFRNIDPSRTRIILIEAGERILPSFDSGLARKTSRSLEQLGVQVWVSSKVTSITAEGVYVGNEFLAARTVLWAAGVKSVALNEDLPVAKDRGGRIIVTPQLNLEAFPDVYVVGDQGCFIGEDGKPLPGLAPVAIQQGEWAAKNILDDYAGKPQQPFRYFDKGQLATIGRRRAVMQWGKLKLHGFIAWLIWLFVHIYYLIGFRNKIFVFIEWAWHYLSYARGARLIVSKEWQTFHSKPTSKDHLSAGTAAATPPSQD
jgi:NADH dehydrogenase